MSFDYDSLPRDNNGSVIGPSLSAVTSPIATAVLIPWEHGRIGVEIELEDGSSHAREVDASGLWRPIETAPLNTMFWALRQGGLEQVHRFDFPGVENAVINPQTGKWWQPQHWTPVLLPPAPQKQEG